MENKKALVVFSTDWHLQKENIQQITDLVKQQCELAEQLGVKTIIALGDILESRVAQREDVLTTFNEILDIVHTYNLKLVCIPGNHDKTVYSSRNSFLTTE